MKLVLRKTSLVFEFGKTVTPEINFDEKQMYGGAISFANLSPSYFGKKVLGVRLYSNGYSSMDVYVSPIDKVAASVGSTKVDSIVTPSTTGIHDIMFTSPITLGENELIWFQITDAVTTGSYWGWDNVVYYGNIFNASNTESFDSQTNYLCINGNKYSGGKGVLYSLII